jgi:hypothetical protein
MNNNIYLIDYPLSFPLRWDDLLLSPWRKAGKGVAKSSGQFLSLGDCHTFPIFADI